MKLKAFFKRLNDIKVDKSQFKVFLSRNNES